MVQTKILLCQFDNHTPFGTRIDIAYTTNINKQ
jgi:hypothetical protein